MSGSAARQLLLLPASNGFEIQFRKPLVVRLTVPRKKGFGAPLLNTAARRSVVRYSRAILPSVTLLGAS